MNDQQSEDRLELVERQTGTVIATSRQLGPTAAIHLQKESGRPFDEVDVYRIKAGRRELITGRPHESGLRSLMAQAGQARYEPVASLDEARTFADGVLVIEGDFGGQIHVTAPVRLVQCSVDRLDRLASELEEIAWPSKRDLGSVSVLFERLAVGSHVAGGMGGARVIDGVWVHDEFKQLGLDKAIAAIVEGREEGDLPEPPAHRA